jgi:hemerythrin-like metal-binding protein
VPVHWDPSYSIGIELFDIQHQAMIRRQRRLGEAIGSERPAAVALELLLLQRDTVRHFRAEERWMAENCYPEAAEHERAHRVCLEALEAAVRRHAASGVCERFLELLERVTRWLDVHLSAEDLRLGTFYAKLAASGRGQPAARHAGEGEQVTGTVVRSR